jgi:ATP-dependent DNA helicase RecG
MNNGNKISPTYYLSIEEIEIQDKSILYIFVPESSQVHRCNGRIFDRYDDRDDIRTNLIESYDRLMAFVAKHLPDKFYLEGDQRISIRDHIFREVVSNILIHRDYGNPYPKNPVIARFFKEIGWVDELGSGVRKIYKYSRTYFGFNPQIIEEDIFRIILQTTTSELGNKNERFNERIMSDYERIMGDFNKNEKKIITFLIENDKITNKIAVEMTELSPAHVRRIFKSLQEKGLIIARGRGRSRFYTLKALD